VLDLYDPDRATVILGNGQQKSWEEFRLALTNALNPIRAKGGSGLHILTETVLSPVLFAQIQAVLKLMPNAKWHQYTPAGPHSARTASMAVYGRPVNTIYHFDKA